MKIFWRPDATAAMPLRHRLLERTFIDQFGPRADNATHLDLPEALHPDTHDVFLGLGALAAARSCGVSVFCGLIAAPEAMLGTNLLICFRPLGAELDALQARHPGLSAASRDWCRDVLGNLTGCVFVNHSDLRASVGFSPWCDLRLVPRFPVRLAQPHVPGETLPVHVFVHSDIAATGAATLVETLQPHADVVVVTADAPPPGDTIRPGGIHIHCGYDRIQPVAVLSPWDSIANGCYCYVLDQSHRLDDPLTEFVKTRSYAEIMTVVGDIAAAVRSTIDRTHSFGQANLRFNPEIGRHDIMNRRFFEECFAQLDRELAP